VGRRQDGLPDSHMGSGSPGEGVLGGEEEPGESPDQGPENKTHMAATGEKQWAVLQEPRSRPTESRSSLNRWEASTSPVRTGPLA